MKYSRRTRWLVGIPFVVTLGCAWYWVFATAPRREIWYLVAFSIALGLVFEGLERKVWSPRGPAERFVLELLYAVLTLMVAGWFMSVVFHAH